MIEAAEIWKDIPGYEGFYQASNLGNIRSIDRVVPHGKNGFVKAKSKQLKAALYQGYYKVALCTNRKLKSFYVHKLVAITFIGPKIDGKEINHIDGNKINNSVLNLEWCSRSENVQHAFDTGLAKARKGSSNGNSKLKEDQILEIRNLWTSGNYMQKDIAKIFGVSTAHVKDIIHKRRGVWSQI